MEKQIDLNWYRQVDPEISLHRDRTIDIERDRRESNKKSNKN